MKRKYDEMKYNKSVRYYKGLSLYYFENYEKELKYLKYKKKIIYPIALMPENALFYYNYTYYRLKYYDNSNEKVVVYEYDIINKKYLRKTNLKSKINALRILY